jgi:hypothetical protein
MNAIKSIFAAALFAWTLPLAAQDECAANGHFYQLVTGGVSWSAAETAAAAMTRNDVAGYLATVTSAEENACVAAVANGASVWLGGNDIDVEGTWAWITGEAWAYTNWNGGEPNNSGNEDCLHMRAGASNWNDLPCSNTGQGGYVVEFEPAADISVTGVDNNGGADVVAGSSSDNISYTFTVENLGPDSADGVASDLVIELSYPWDGTVYCAIPTPVDGTITINDDTATWSGVSLASGDSATIDLDCTATSAALHNSVFGASLTVMSIENGVDTVPGNDSAELSSTIIREATVNVTKTWDGEGSGEVNVMLTCNDALVESAATSGGMASFTVTGFEDAYSCVVTEEIPAGFAPTYTDCSVAPVTSGMTYECGIANAETRATFMVTKTYSDMNSDPVTVTLTCDTGLPLEQSFEISDGNPVNFVLTNFVEGTPNCEVTETGSEEGYTPSFDNGIDPVSMVSCMYSDVTAGDYTCSIVNAADAAMYTVGIDWVLDDASVVEPDYSVEVTVTCTSNILTVNGSVVAPSMEYVGMVEAGFPVVLGVDTYDGVEQCTAVQSVTQSGVEPEASEGCTDADLAPGGSASCVFTNTVFFEGIPTLSQYGMALMALLMLGVGFRLCRHAPLCLIARPGFE